MNTVARNRYCLVLAAILANAGVLTGCDKFMGGSSGSDPALQSGQIVGGATKQIADVQPVAGFLPQPELLQRGAPGQAALVYLNPAAKFASYTQVMLDPVTVWAAPDSSLNTVPPVQRQALADTFYSDLYSAVSKVCRIATKPSPGTIHMRFAIVDAKAPNATINTIATYAPYASSAYSAASFAFNKGVGFFAGTATAEGFATDATYGTLLWEGIDKRGGTTSLVENTLDTWLDVNHAFETWSARLAARMQQLGICQVSAVPAPTAPPVKR